MAMTDVLQQDLETEEFSSELKSAILNGLFDCRLSDMRSAKNRNTWGDYFDYYHGQCDFAVNSGGLTRVLRSHGDIIRIAQLLRDPENTRESIKDKERAIHDPTDTDISDDLIYSAIDLVVRVSLMVYVGEKRDFEDVVTGGERTLPWNSGRLDALLESDFKDTGSLAKEHVKLEKLFNASNLERIAGLRIVWTRNLADHLRVRNDDTEVAIFHYVSFLNTQKKRYSSDELSVGIVNISQSSVAARIH